MLEVNGPAGLREAAERLKAEHGDLLDREPEFTRPDATVQMFALERARRRVVGERDPEDQLALDVGR